MKTDDGKKTIKLLIIGSSIVKYIDAKKIERNNPNQSQTTCIRGGKIPDILKELRELQENHNIKNYYPRVRYSYF